MSHRPLLPEQFASRIGRVSLDLAAEYGGGTEGISYGATHGGIVCGE
jgi:hypothetical protein